MVVPTIAMMSSMTSLTLASFGTCGKAKPRAISASGG
jgi:hypothetical protein